MLASYILLGLAGTTLVSYCSKNILATIYRFYSLPASIRKQARDFQNKRDSLNKAYFKKTRLIWKKTIIKQLALHDKNTKTQIRLLAKSTTKQLCRCRNILSDEEQKEIRQSIKQCVSQLDMTELLDINFRLIELNQSSNLFLAGIQNR